MKLLIAFQDGKQIGGTFEGYNPQEFVTKANSQGVLAVAIGTMVTNKNVIKYIVSDEPLAGDPNTEIQLTDGLSIKDYVENYDATEITGQLNEQRSILVVIGNTVVSKNVFKMVLQLPETEPATTTA